MQKNSIKPSIFRFTKLVTSTSIHLYFQSLTLYNHYFLDGSHYIIIDQQQSINLKFNYIVSNLDIELREVSIRLLLMWLSSIWHRLRNHWKTRYKKSWRTCLVRNRFHSTGRRSNGDADKIKSLVAKYWRQNIDSSLWKAKDWRNSKTFCTYALVLRYVFVIYG